MTAAEVREAVGITSLPSPNWRTIFEGRPPEMFWGDITSQAYKDNSDYNYNIPHPSIWLAHKDLNMCFFGQMEINHVSLDNLRSLRSLAQDCDIIPDLSTIFLNICVSRRKESTGRIPLGGIFSLIVRYMDEIRSLSRPNSLDPPVSGAIVYDTRWLVSKGLLETLPNDEFNWRFGKNNVHRFRLPRPLQFGSARSYRILANDEPEPVSLQPLAWADWASGSGSQDGVSWEESLFASMAENAAFQAQYYSTITEQLGNLDLKMGSMVQEQKALMSEFAAERDYVHQIFGHYDTQLAGLREDVMMEDHNLSQLYKDQ